MQARFGSTVPVRTQAQSPHWHAMTAAEKNDILNEFAHDQQNRRAQYLGVQLISSGLHSNGQLELAKATPTNPSKEGSSLSEGGFGAVPHK